MIESEEFNLGSDKWKISYFTGSHYSNITVHKNGERVDKLDYFEQKDKSVTDFVERFPEEVKNYILKINTADSL